MQRVSPRVSLIGLALAGGLIAAMLVAFMLTIGGQGTPKAFANVTPSKKDTPTATSTPTCEPSPSTAVPNKCLAKGTPVAKPGGITGVYDIQSWSDPVADPNAKTKDAYRCIAVQDQYGAPQMPNTIKSSAVCYINTVTIGGNPLPQGIGDPNAEPPNGAAKPPMGPGGAPGGSPPPPYTTVAPSIGYGNVIGGTLHSWTCFQDIGGILGPNLIAEVIIPNFQGQIDGTGLQNGKKRAAMAGNTTDPAVPAALKAPGTGLYLTGGIGQLECEGLASGILPAKLASHAAVGLFIQFTKADSTDAQCSPNCALAPWRHAGPTVPADHATGMGGYPDWDGDGCKDSSELWTVQTGSKGTGDPGGPCGDDPWNPNDVTGTHSDAAGIYSIEVVAQRQDICKGGTWAHQGQPNEFDCTGKPDQTNIPGLYYTCSSYITQNVQALTSKVLCYIDGIVVRNTTPPILFTVNPQTGGGQSCATTNLAYCGDGAAGSAPPGCNPTPTACTNTMPNASNVVTGIGHCPATNSGPPFFTITITCHPERWLFAQISSPGPPSGFVPDPANPGKTTKQTTLTGAFDKAKNVIDLKGCFNNNNLIKTLLGNVYVQAQIDAHTGHGSVNLWAAQTTANCVAGTPKGAKIGPLVINIARQACAAPGTDNTCAAAPYDVAHWDTDGDGCVDAHELSDTIANATDPNAGGGMRDPQNRWDFFDPFKEASPPGGAHKHGALDILIVQQHFGDNEWIKDPANQANPPVLNNGVVNPAIPAYSPAYDRTGIVGSNTWNLGPGNGIISSVDMLIAQKSYGQNCSQTIPTAGS
jgi:hypothetical protein